MSQNQNINQNNFSNDNNTTQYMPGNNYYMNYQNFPPLPPPFLPYNNINIQHNPHFNNCHNLNKQNQIIFVPAQSPITQVNPNNSTHPTLLGNSLIPMLNEKPISASQKYHQIVNYFFLKYENKLF